MAPSAHPETRVLHVDDDPAFADLTADVLERQRASLVVETATSVAEGLEVLADGTVDCVVSDYDMSGRNGIEFLETVREEYPDLPFILFTGTGSEEVADEAISAGVTDYLRKDGGTDQYALLADRVVNAAEQARAERTRRRQLEAIEASGLVCAVRDVSGHEEREQEPTRYRRLTEAMGDPVYVLDADGHYTYVNDALVEAFGYEREELLGEHASLVISDPAFERGSDLIRELLADEDRQSVTWELETVTAEGEEVVVENRLALLPSADGEFRGTVGAVRDITEHRDRERDLRRYEQMVNAMQEAACLYDEEGRFVVVNEYLADFYGTTREALRGRKSALVPAVREESDGDPYAELLAGEREQFRGWVTSEFPGRGTETLSYRLVPLTVDGETEGVVGIAREVTESGECERKLERQNERLEELASVVSHDLRNPLNVAQGRAELARDGSDSVHLDAVVHALDRMEALVDDLLALAREDGAVEGTEPVDLRRAVGGCWRTVDTAGATLITDTDRVVRADYNRLQQLLENLLGNAVDHGGDGVTVTVGDLPDGFYVADDGPGIPLEERERVFQSGYSTAEGGTGLGLAIVREVARAHGWTVTVTGSADGGARLEVTGVEVV